MGLNQDRGALTAAAAQGHPIFRPLLLKLSVLNNCDLNWKISHSCDYSIKWIFQKLKTATAANNGKCAFVYFHITVTLALLWVGMRHASARSKIKTRRLASTNVSWLRFQTKQQHAVGKNKRSGIYMYNCHCRMWTTTFRCWIFKPPGTAITTADDGFLCSYNCKQLHCTQVRLCCNLILCALSVYYCPLI